MLFSILPLNVFAGTHQEHTTQNNSMLRWVNTAVVTVDLFINSSGRATLTGLIIGNTGVENITGTAVLERMNPNGTTTHIHTWYDMSTNGSTWAWEGHQFVTRGHDYRFTLTATVVRNGVNEEVSLSRVARAN